jgi:hypothetical protein
MNDICSTHHAERLVNPNVLAKKTVTDFRYTLEHVDSEKPNRHISLGPPLTNFFQNVIFTL